MNELLVVSADTHAASVCRYTARAHSSTEYTAIISGRRTCHRTVPEREGLLSSAGKRGPTQQSCNGRSGAVPSSVPVCGTLEKVYFKS
jgi:hypothetical protein